MGNDVVKQESPIEEKYDIRRKLGHGSFATVNLAVRKSDKQQFAVKIIQKNKLDEKELEAIKDEVSVLQKIEQPNCVKLYEVFDSPKTICLVLELLAGGELFDRIVAKGSFSEQEASATVKAIATGLAYLHSKGVVHRDLKPENLLYLDNRDESPLKITDFGLAKFIDQELEEATLRTACGTPAYVAPEVLRQQGYTSAVDMWSLGVILYILLCGFPPFYHENTPELFAQIKEGTYDFPAPYWNDISQSAKDLVKKLLEMDPKKRYTAAEVLEHPWITNKPSDKVFAGGFNDRMKLLSARKKLRAGIQMIMAINKFADSVDAGIARKNSVLRVERKQRVAAKKAARPTSKSTVK